MKKQDAESRLRELIAAKEVEQQIQRELVKEHFHQVYESLSPMNIVKNSFKNFFAGPGLKGSIIDTAIGVTTGFVARKAYVGRSHNPLKKLAGMAVEALVARTASKHADTIKTVGSYLLKNIFGKKEQRTEQPL
jgi:hypothetical protein